MSDEEWRIVEPLLPTEHGRKSSFRWPPQKSGCRTSHNAFSPAMAQIACKPTIAYQPEPAVHPMVET
ncbi:transposase [Agrobacterium tumefaciens]|uniref:transposase n=1 Tax=Agrobacterium tumefaciens TaxID=358 RepID=UPI0021CFB092|nr:transposase [Agrobacterium tumefaciens]